ncbi:hypothetical protein B0H17DRAFT_1147676 [Mycena rosella]|uniref:Uncharacterized protein n=1 Tax=Mycena rosella TaxID=1033263 RepID=A0AAD7CL43_MYCRO|nr:hypothetical protein B0H17DRAFT_1147676 [Mycena rosella]
MAYDNVRTTDDRRKEGREEEERKNGQEEQDGKNEVQDSKVHGAPWQDQEQGRVQSIKMASSEARVRRSGAVVEIVPSSDVQRLRAGGRQVARRRQVQEQGRLVNANEDDGTQNNSTWDASHSTMAGMDARRLRGKTPRKWAGRDQGASTSTQIPFAGWTVDADGHGCAGGAGRVLWMMRGDAYRAMRCSGMGPDEVALPGRSGSVLFS